MLIQRIHFDRITVPENRQRSEAKDSKALQELKRSILSKGLLHAPIVSRQQPSELSDGRYHQPEETVFVLVAGERRLLAIKELYQDGLEFYYNDELVPSGDIPYTLIGQLTIDDLAEAELEENILRADLTWKEEAQAKVLIDTLRKRNDPTHTTTDTANELAEVKGTLPITERLNLVRAQAVLPHLGAPSVKGASTLRKAYKVVLDSRQAQLARDLRRISHQPSPHTVILGDCREVMKTLEKGTFDAIISDPPYGIDADKMKQENGHRYDDSKGTALALFQDILRRGFHLLKPQGIIFLFCDIEHFITIRTYAEQQAFSTWRTPIIWSKGSEGFAPWGKNGFARTYETILFAVKGQKPLTINPGSDVRLVKRTVRNDNRQHAAEKPPELLRFLLEISTQPGAKVLDPCCGSAPIIPAAKGLNLSLTCIEISAEYHQAACTRLATTEEEAAPESLVAIPKGLEDYEAEIFNDEG